MSSVNFRSVGYDPAARVLEVEFLDGSVYQFRKVSPATYLGMSQSKSLDHYFDKYIRGRYPSRQKP